MYDTFFRRDNLLCRKYYFFFETNVFVVFVVKGKITWKQAKTGFLNLGYNESEVNNLSVGSDKTLKKKSSKRRKYNDNNITFDQFISYTMNFQIPKKEDNQKEKSQHAFQLLDHDNSGAITFHHLKRAAKILGEPFTDEELQEMMDEMDLDGDGQINFQEFLRIMKKVNLY